MRHYSRIVSTGSYLPPNKVSNVDMAERLASLGVETSHEWILERTGITYRHFASQEMASSDLATFAAQNAIEAAGLQATDIDLIIVATTTPDMVFPSTAAIVQSKLGAPGGAAFDVQAVCSGFIYALSIADALIQTGSAKKALIIGAETFSRLLDFHDRRTCVLFGDGAGAVILEASDQPGIWATELHADGRHSGILCVPGHVRGGEIFGHAMVQMDGPAVFKLAVSSLAEVGVAVLQKAGKQASDIDWLVPHQANIRIMQSTAKKLHLPEERVIITVGDHGNTSAASIPLALDVGVRDGRIARGDTLLLEGVGGGFTWGAALIDF